MERYLVFARTEYDEPLEHRGDVEAADDDAAKLARERYGQRLARDVARACEQGLLGREETEEGETEVQV